MVSQEAPSVATDDTEPGPLGPCLHTFETPVRVKHAPRRLMELVGVTSAVMVPVGLLLVEGTIGTVMSVVGGLLTVGAYLLSGRKPAPQRIAIRVFERGVEASQGSASRTVHWNEVLDVQARKLTSPDGRQSLALVLEVVGAAPLLIVVGGTFTDVDNAGKLVEALERSWLPVWCRRTRVQLENDRTVRVGQARLSVESLQLGEQTLRWQDVSGIETDQGTDWLRTREGVLEVEQDASGGLVPFPSTAKRLAALAAEPPSRPLLPPLPVSWRPPTD